MRNFRTNYTTNLWSGTCGTLLSTARHGFGPPWSRPELRQNAKNMSFENISNLYKELGYDSTHHCDIVAGSLYKITSSLKFSLVSVVGGLGTPWDPELAESLLLPY